MLPAAGQVAAGQVAQRRAALLALLLPTGGGLAWLAWAGAPAGWLAVNGAALAAGLLWIAAGQCPASPALRRIIAAMLLAILALPLMTGPEINDVARWIPLGPFTLHAGMLVLPALVVLAARDAPYAAPLLLSAMLLALLQPDAASLYALTFAAAGLYHAGDDWKVGASAAAGFFAGIAALLRGELAPQMFVERVLVDAAYAMPAAGLGLFALMAASFALIVLAVPLERPARLALAGSVFGFTLLSIASNYPSPLIGYGASPILGYALALGLVRKARP
jgi:cell division protein FtsW (lipid II flippase)